MILMYDTVCHYKTCRVVWWLLIDVDFDQLSVCIFVYKRNSHLYSNDGLKYLSIQSCYTYLYLWLWTDAMGISMKIIIKMKQKYMNRIYFKNNANLKLVQRCIFFAISVVFCAKKKIGITECDYLHFQFFFLIGMVIWSVTKSNRNGRLCNRKPFPTLWKLNE